MSFYSTEHSANKARVCLLKYDFKCSTHQWASGTRDPVATSPDVLPLTTDWLTTTYQEQPTGPAVLEKVFSMQNVEEKLDKVKTFSSV